MHETYSSFRSLRQHVLREAAEVISECVRSIDHDPLRRARMCALSLKRNRGCSRTPGLVADFAQSLTIHRICDLRTESFDVKLLNAAADFFIRSECDCQHSMFDLWVLTKGIDHCHDLGNSSFVIRAEQCCAIGRNDVVSDHV